MTEKRIGIVYRSQPHKEADKRVFILTEGGPFSAVVKGAKKEAARLKSFVEPFSFCEFTFFNRNDYYQVIGASPVFDFKSELLKDYDRLTAASVILEAGVKSFDGEFEYLIDTLKALIISNNHLLTIIRFVQHTIHSSGYGYEYQVYDAVESPLQLLSYINYNENTDDLKIEKSLIKKTLNIIIKNFEDKFEVKIKSMAAICE